MATQQPIATVNCSFPGLPLSLIYGNKPNTHSSGPTTRNSSKYLRRSDVKGKSAPAEKVKHERLAIQNLGISGLDLAESCHAPNTQTGAHPSDKFNSGFPTSRTAFSNRSLTRHISSEVLHKMEPKHTFTLQNLVLEAPDKTRTFIYADDPGSGLSQGYVSKVVDKYPDADDPDKLQLDISAIFSTDYSSFLDPARRQGFSVQTLEIPVQASARSNNTEHVTTSKRHTQGDHAESSEHQNNVLSGRQIDRDNAVPFEQRSHYKEATTRRRHSDDTNMSLRRSQDRNIAPVVSQFSAKGGANITPQHKRRDDDNSLHKHSTYCYPSKSNKKKSSVNEFPGPVGGGGDVDYIDGMYYVNNQEELFGLLSQLSDSYEQGRAWIAEVDRTTRFPRIVVKNENGRVLDTDTIYQRDIAAARFRVARGGELGPLEWRLPHAPIPSKPDFSRRKLVPETERQKVTSTSQPPVNTAPTQKQWEFDGINHQQDLYRISWDVGQFETLPPLVASGLLRQNVDRMPQRVYLRLAGNNSVLNKLSKEKNAPQNLTVTSHPEAGDCDDVVLPPFAYGGRRPAELCYGCELGNTPHFHKDKTIRTGGGFTYYLRDGLKQRGKNPARWKVPHDEEKAKQISLEKYDLAETIHRKRAPLKEDIKERYVDEEDVNTDSGRGTALIDSLDLDWDIPKTDGNSSYMIHDKYANDLYETLRPLTENSFERDTDTRCTSTSTGTKSARRQNIEVPTTTGNVHKSSRATTSTQTETDEYPTSESKCSSCTHVADDDIHNKVSGATTESSSKYRTLRSGSKASDSTNSSIGLHLPKEDEVVLDKAVNTDGQGTPKHLHIHNINLPRAVPHASQSHKRTYNGNTSLVELLKKMDNKRKQATANEIHTVGHHSNSEDYSTGEDEENRLRERNIKLPDIHHDSMKPHSDVGYQGSGSLPLPMATIDFNPPIPVLPAVQRWSISNSLPDWVKRMRPQKRLKRSSLPAVLMSQQYLELDRDYFQPRVPKPFAVTPRTPYEENPVEDPWPSNTPWEKKQQSNRNFHVHKSDKALTDFSEEPSRQPPLWNEPPPFETKTGGHAPESPTLPAITKDGTLTTAPREQATNPATPNRWNKEPSHVISRQLTAHGPSIAEEGSHFGTDSETEDTGGVIPAIDNRRAISGRSSALPENYNKRFSARRHKTMTSARTHRAMTSPLKPSQLLSTTPSFDQPFRVLSFDRKSSSDSFTQFARSLSDLILNKVDSFASVDRVSQRSLTILIEKLTPVSPRENIHKDWTDEGKGSAPKRRPRTRPNTQRAAPEQAQPSDVKKRDREISDVSVLSDQLKVEEIVIPSTDVNLQPTPPPEKVPKSESVKRKPKSETAKKKGKDTADRKRAASKEPTVLQSELEHLPEITRLPTHPAIREALEELSSSPPPPTKPARQALRKLSVTTPAVAQEPLPLPEDIEEEEYERKYDDVTPEEPPPMPEPELQRKPRGHTKKKKKEKRPAIIRTTAPITKRELKEVGDPLDYLARFCIIHPDRLPQYERVFKKITSEQPYRYDDVPGHTHEYTPLNGDVTVSSNTLSSSLTSGGAPNLKTSLEQHERRLLQDMTLISRHADPDVAGMGPGDEMMNKVTFTLDHLIDRYETLQEKITKLNDHKIQLMAGLARDMWPQVAQPGYSPVGSNNTTTAPRTESKWKPSDLHVVNRLGQKMMAVVNEDPDVHRVNLEIQHLQNKLRSIDDRIEDLEDEKKLLQLYSREDFHQKQKSKARPDEFRRKQSALYQANHPNVDVEMNVNEVEGALQVINGHLITHKEMQYIYHILELPGRQRINFQMFSVVAALSEKVTQLEPIVRKLINKFDFEALSVKMDKCKELFYLLDEQDSDIPDGMVTVMSLIVELTAGGVTPENTQFVMDKFNREKKGVVDFLDFLTYVPLFIEIHGRIINDPFSDIRDL